MTYEKTGGPNRDPYERSEEWRRHATDFCVVIHHHQVWLLDPMNDKGPHRWAVYAYIYPKHPLFDTFDDDSIFQEATNGLPLHWGCTLLRRHYDKFGAVTSIQVGADYDHLHDEWFSHAHNRELASEVFHDADLLFDHLAERKRRTE